jgi:hypothetical protein
MGEGFGMVRSRRWSARPVIAASIGGLGELVDDEVTGLLVAPGEADPLTEAIVRLAGDLDLAARMGEAGRRRALADFLEERCIDRTEELYEVAADRCRRCLLRSAIPATENPSARSRPAAPSVSALASAFRTATASADRSARYPVAPSTTSPEPRQRRRHGLSASMPSSIAIRSPPSGRWTPSRQR